MEQRLRALELDVATIKETMATKEHMVDFYKALNAQTWKMVGAVAFMTGLFTYVVKML